VPVCAARRARQLAEDVATGDTACAVRAAAAGSTRAWRAPVQPDLVLQAPVFAVGVGRAVREVAGTRPSSPARCRARCCRDSR
jgi:hypothetical protein